MRGHTTDGGGDFQLDRLMIAVVKNGKLVRLEAFGPISVSSPIGVSRNTPPASSFCMRYSDPVKKTTVNLDDKVFMLVRAKARREGRPVGEVINELLAAAFPDAYKPPSYIGAYEGDVDDLGINAEKYLREGLR